VAPPQRTGPQLALRYVAEDGVTGYTLSAARLVRALRDAGVAVEMTGWTMLHLAGHGEAATHTHDEPSRAARVAADAPTVMHMVPEHLPFVQTRFAGAPIVVHTVWETDRLPRHWPQLLNRSEGVLVPTEWNRDVFAASGVRVPIEVVPHVACDPRPAAGGGGEPLRIDEDRIVFYTISRWDERKTPALAVAAFLQAFTADDPVALVVKTGPIAEMRPPDGWGSDSPRYQTTDWQIARLLRGHPRPPPIHLFVEEWDEPRIAALHERGDCYLTLTHGEGWGIGSFDACAHGNPVIATGWSGHLDYLEGSETLVDYDLVAVAHLAAGSYSPDQRWAQPRLEHAVERLRAVAADPAGARAAAAPLRERLLARYSGPVVAQRFIDAIDRIL
jgi:glycosyltransferase involved in cell wall biosynthesis